MKNGLVPIQVAVRESGAGYHSIWRLIHQGQVHAVKARLRGCRQGRWFVDLEQVKVALAGDQPDDAFEVLEEVDPNASRAEGTRPRP